MPYSLSALFSPSQIKFYPAGRLTVHLGSGKGIAFPEQYLQSNNAASRIDAYCQLSLEGKTTRMVKRTAADRDGGSDPVWNYDMAFDVVDQYMLDLEVLHQSIEVGGADVTLGSVQLSLLPVYRNGTCEFWTSLKQKKATGGAKEIGDVHISMSFIGPLGVSFPQFRPDVDSFDDRMRKRPDRVDEVDEDVQDNEGLKNPISTVPVKEHHKKQLQQQVAPPLPQPQQQPDGETASIVDEPSRPPPPEFTEAEIQAAFAFIDLDHNSFVGAKEIRHILGMYYLLKLKIVAFNVMEFCDGSVHGRNGY
jgi:hypothetical protein